MNQDPKKLSKEIENIILSIQDSIKNKNYGYLTGQILSLNKLILSYLLALDYEIKSLNIPNNEFNKIKELINLNLQRISEYLKTRDEKLINEVQASLSQMYNLLFEPQETEITKWSDIEEQKFFQILQQISELSNKIYLYYTKKSVPFEEILNLAKNVMSSIEKLPR